MGGQDVGHERDSPAVSSLGGPATAGTRSNRTRPIVMDNEISICAGIRFCAGVRVALLKQGLNQRLSRIAASKNRLDLLRSMRGIQDVRAICVTG